LDPKAKDFEREMIKNKKFILSRGTENGSGGRKLAGTETSGTGGKYPGKEIPGTRRAARHTGGSNTKELSGREVARGPGFYVNR